MDKKLKFFIKYGIGILILIFLFAKIDFNQAIQLFKNIDILFILLAFLFQASGIFTNVMNIQLLLRPSLHIPYFKLLRYQLINFVGSVILPLSISEISQIYLLKRNHQLKPGIYISTLVMDKLITVIVISLIALTGVFLFFDLKYIYFILLFLFLLAFSLYLIYYNKFFKKIALKIIPKKIIDNLEGSIYHFKVFRNHPNLIFYNFIITIIRSVFQSIVIYLIFLALGFNVNFLIVLFVSSMDMLSIIFQLTPGGLGIRQGIGFYFYSLFGLSITAVMSMYLVSIVLKYLLALLLSFFIAIPKFKLQKAKP